MSNVRTLWMNIIMAGATTVVLLFFADGGSFLWFFGGLVYAIFFEYFYHRYIGHTDKFPLASEKHRQHHREWRGEDLVSTDRMRPHLSEDWYFYPVALLMHFAIGKVMFGIFPWEVLIAFTLFYLQFEILHFCTHIEDNIIDELLLEIPLLRDLRLIHIEHHLTHHGLPSTRFNFSYPYIGDRVFGTEHGPKD